MQQRRPGGLTLKQADGAGHSSSRLMRRKKAKSTLPISLSVLFGALVCLIGAVSLIINVIPNEALQKAPNPSKPTVQRINQQLATPRQLPLNRSRSHTTSTNSKSGGEPQIHTVFSTGCSNFQDWQSYIFFFHAWKSGQKGTVTRIASGCRENDAKTLKALHDKQIRIMSDQFHLHLTPDFSRLKPGLNFKYFNKPFGLRHWMENSLGYPQNANEHDDSIIILLDPDQMLLRPFTGDFSSSKEVWKPTSSKNVRVARKVEHGSPFAQQYGFYLQWKTKVNMTHVAKGEYSRIDEMDKQEARDHYAAGPPYLATAKDMYQIALTWTDFVPRVYDNYPHLLAEMFAYCLAAAHLNLPHMLAHSFMVSDVSAGGEGWPLVDQMEKYSVCRTDPPPRQEDVPHVIHYCQRYMLGKWFIGKYRLRKDFISCASPLLMEPPPSIVEKTYQIPPDGSRLGFKSSLAAQRNAFVICNMIPRLNQAAEFYKQHHCPLGKTNFNKTYIFHASIADD